MTPQELAYGQQKNREHIWQQVKDDFKNAMETSKESLIDDLMDYRYLELCKSSNITPW